VIYDNALNVMYRNAEERDLYRSRHKEELVAALEKMAAKNSQDEEKVALQVAFIRADWLGET
jgi:hypothetical protein